MKRVDLVVEPERDLAEPARALVELEHRVEELRAARGFGLDHAALLEAQADVVDLAALEERGEARSGSRPRSRSRPGSCRPRRRACCSARPRTATRARRRRRGGRCRGRRYAARGRGRGVPHAATARISSPASARRRRRPPRRGRPGRRNARTRPATSRRPGRAPASGTGRRTSAARRSRSGPSADWSARACAAISRWCRSAGALPRARVFASAQIVTIASRSRSRPRRSGETKSSCSSLPSLIRSSGSSSSSTFDVRKCARRRARRGRSRSRAEPPIGGVSIRRTLPGSSSSE